MGNNHFNSATLDDATLGLIKRKTRMKSSEINTWYSELKGKNKQFIFIFMRAFIRGTKEKFPIDLFIHLQIGYDEMN